MKPIYLLALLLSMIFDLALAQEATKKNPLSDGAFDKMIIQDITYAIVGENTPVSGLKIDISKPEATISGVFGKKNSSLLFGLEFKGGVTDKNFPILKGTNNFNTAFEMKPSFHWIPSASSAMYGPEEEAAPKVMLLRAKAKLVEESKLALVDSFYATALIRDRHLAVVNGLADAKILSAARANMSHERKKAIIYFIKKIMKDESLLISPGLKVEAILAFVPQASVVNDDIQVGSYYDQVEVLYRKYEKLFKTVEDDADNKLISNASEIWTKKKYWWITLSPYARTEKINEHHTKFEERDSLYFQPDYKLYFGGSLYFNRYYVKPNKRANLYRVGVTLSKSNNITTLTGFNYETRTPFYTNGPSATHKTESGTAYNHSEIDEGFSKQLLLEYYRLPLRSMFPGIFISANVNRGELNRLPNVVGREDDMTRVGLETGLVFNINSREKDKEKSILSILTYFQHQDLTDKLRTPRQTGEKESWSKFNKRNLSFGFRVGIPINLPQRTE